MWFRERLELATPTAPERVALRLRGKPDLVRTNLAEVARHLDAARRLLGPRAVRFKHTADAPATRRMALCLHFGPQPTRPIALAVVRKRLAHHDLLGWFGRRYPPTAMPSAIRGWGHPQYLPELAHGQVPRPLSDVLTGAHGVGWPKMTKAFIKISSS